VCEGSRSFAAAYGAEAGNMVLKALATGGMYRGRHRAENAEDHARRVFMQAFYRQGAVERIADSHAGAHHSGEPRRADGAAAVREARAAEISGKSVRAASRKLCFGSAKW